MLSLFAPAPAQAQSVPTNVLSNDSLNPVNIVVTPGDGKLDLTWQATSQAGTHWWVQYKRQTDTAWTTSTSTIAWTTLSHSITGLTGGILYDVRIFGAVESGGTMYRSPFFTRSGTPTGMAMRADVMVSLTPTTLRVNEGEQVQFQLSFSKPPSDRFGLIPLLSEDRCALHARYHDVVSGISFNYDGYRHRGIQTIYTRNVSEDTVCTIRIDEAKMPVGYIAGTDKTLTLTIVDTGDDDIPPPPDGTPPPTGDTPPPGGGDPGEGSRRGQIQDAVKRTLSALARRAMASTMDHIGARFGDLGTGGVSLAGRQASLRDHPALAGLTGDGRGPHCAASGCLAPSGRRSMTVGELFGQSGFSVHLNAAPDGRGSAATPRWSVWGRGDFGSFAGRGDPGRRYDGNLRTGWVGIDARSGPWVAGLAVSHGEGDADYAFSGGAVSGGGRLDTKLTAVYPYGRWMLDNGLELHGVVGVGSGDADHRPGDGETESGDLTMRLASAGFRHAFPERDGLSLAVRADASVIRIKTDHGPDDIHGLSADSWRLRAGLEASRRVALERGAELQPFLEAAVRHDGGDGLDGNGMELAGGLRYAAPGVYLEARGRWLATHSDKGAQEKGVSVTARAGPGTNGRGLFFALSPRWGAHAGGAQTLWGEATATPSASADQSSVDAQLGYAFAAPVPGVLTPFVETRLAGDAHRSLRLGTRFEAAHGNLRMELVGERSENGAARPEHALRFTLRLSFF